MPFVDWLSCRVPYSAVWPVQGGQIVRLKRDGTVERSTRLRHQVEGSYTATVAVRTVWEGGPFAALEVSGNPTKFLQGHNVWGSSDLRGLAVAMVLRVCSALQLPYTSDELARWRGGDIALTRVDVTAMSEKAPAAVPTWLSLAAQVLRSGRQATKAHGQGETVYVGQGSTRSSVKFYDKFKELTDHPERLLLQAPLREVVLDWCQDRLRVEVQLRSKVLQDKGLQLAAAWRTEVFTEVLGDAMGKLTFADNVVVAAHDEVLEGLPARLKGVYALWLRGEDLRPPTYSKNTFYRYRRELLAASGGTVDIAIVRPHVVQPREEYPLGAPLRSFLKWEDGPPSWAGDLGLLALA